ncbi:MAG: hypothetical protein V1921_06505 [Candidatus Altiarchaeota archaeon]
MKIVKLKLEDGSETLPKLKVSTVDEAVNLFDHLGQVNSFERYYLQAAESTQNFNVDSRQLQGILQKLEEKHSDEILYSVRAGLFLTALMRKSQSELFDIEPKIPLDFVGYWMEGSKTVRIHGNAGNHLGWSLRSGNIEVDENSGASTGRGMSGGTITVKKNTGWQTGVIMQGGIINVGGNAGEETGDGMTGGIIKVDGKISGISGSYKKGEIWEGNVKKRPKEK